MKNYIFNFLKAVVLLLLFSACKSTKKGCGLTSDTTQIQSLSNPQTEIVTTLN